MPRAGQESTELILEQLRMLHNKIDGVVDAVAELRESRGRTDSRLDGQERELGLLRERPPSPEGTFLSALRIVVEAPPRFLYVAAGVVLIVSIAVVVVFQGDSSAIAELFAKLGD